MTVRTTDRPAATRRPVDSGDWFAPAPTGLADRALDDALDHITDLAERLWAVRRAHPVVARRSLFGGRRLWCGGCGHSAPCPTLRAAGPV